MSHTRVALQDSQLPSHQTSENKVLETSTLPPVALHPDSTPSQVTHEEATTSMRMLTNRENTPRSNFLPSNITKLERIPLQVAFENGTIIV